MKGVEDNTAVRLACLDLFLILVGVATTAKRIERPNTLWIQVRYLKTAGFPVEASTPVTSRKP